eukprot:Skav209862  [mRNA]  locus=scaffold1684:498950:500966:- [translate_table: standard]
MVSTLWLHAVLAFTTLVTALRHYDDDVMHGYEEAGPADDEVTPRLSAERLAYLQETEPPSATSAIELNPKCKPSTFSDTGKMLGQGEDKELFIGKFFALKVPRKGTERSAEHEIAVMKDATEHQCSKVLPLVEANPCVDNEKMMYAYVTQLLPWDLQKWKKAGKADQKCFEKVILTIQAALKCLHGAGYMHGDLKADNVLFEDLDSDGCPNGIRLADFGISHKLRTLQLKYGQEYYMGSSHLAGTVFDGVQDPFRLTQVRRDQRGKTWEYYTVDVRLDFCSLAGLAWNLFELKLTGYQDWLPVFNIFIWLVNDSKWLVTIG